MQELQTVDYENEQNNRGRKKEKEQQLNDFFMSVHGKAIIKTKVICLL